MQRIVCDTCGHLTDDALATIGDKHDGCPFDGSWQPFPDLSPQLAVDLVCQQLTKAPDDLAFDGVTQMLEYLDLVVWGCDEAIARLRDICNHRLETGRWRGAAVQL